MLLSRNKSEAYKRLVLKQLEALMGFLKEEGLIVIDPFDDSGNLKQDFVLSASGSSREGVELFKCAIPAWFKYLDAGGDVNNLSSLKKALASLHDK